jgi:hypothetical protein
VVVRLHYAAGGSITLVADPGYFRNRTWRRSNAPYFLVPLLAPARPGPITWDEYHQGFGAGPSLAGVTLGWLTGTPLGWALLQLVAVALIALAVQAVRFGPARTVIERRRRSPLEHLEALAAGLEGAAGFDTAVRLFIAGLWRRLSRTGLAPQGDGPDPLDALALAVGTERGRLAVRRLQEMERTRGGPERVLAAAQSVEDVWEELRPRTKRGGS